MKPFKTPKEPTHEQLKQRFEQLVTEMILFDLAYHGGEGYETSLKIDVPEYEGKIDYTLKLINNEKVKNG